MEASVEVLTWRLELEPFVMEAKGEASRLKCGTGTICHGGVSKGSHLKGGAGTICHGAEGEGSRNCSCEHTAHGLWIPCTTMKLFTLVDIRISVKDHAAGEGVHHFSSKEQCSWLIPLSRWNTVRLDGNIQFISQTIFTKFSMVYFTWYFNKIPTTHQDSYALLTINTVIFDPRFRSLFSSVLNVNGDSLDTKEKTHAHGLFVFPTTLHHVHVAVVYSHLMGWQVYVETVPCTEYSVSPLLHINKFTSPPPPFQRPVSSL